MDWAASTCFQLIEAFVKNTLSMDDQICPADLILLAEKNNGLYVLLVQVHTWDGLMVDMGKYRQDHKDLEFSLIEGLENLGVHVDVEKTSGN
jgi:hypothetical protein